MFLANLHNKSRSYIPIFHGIDICLPLPFEQWLHEQKLIPTLEDEPKAEDTGDWEEMGPNEVHTFKFHGVLVDQTKKPWFIGKEVASLLEYIDTDQAIRKHCKHAKLLKGTESVRLGLAPHGVYLIPESDLFRLVMRSNMPLADDDDGESTLDRIEVGLKPRAPIRIVIEFGLYYRCSGHANRMPGSSSHEILLDPLVGESGLMCGLCLWFIQPHASQGPQARFFRRSDHP